MLLLRFFISSLMNLLLTFSINSCFVVPKWIKWRSSLFVPDLSYMCCVARRRPQPRHRWLYSSPYTRTQGAERFNILFASPHPGCARVTCPRPCLNIRTNVLVKKEKTIRAAFLLNGRPRSRRVEQRSTCTQDVPPRPRAGRVQSAADEYALY